ncbi:MAG TPA: glycosyltransferase [Chloroflexaceae bacterium]|nr:glycosyltransferase [Chloroflexaceae bacterium]
MSRPRVLALVDYYLPGYKSGGPLRTIANMVARLGDRLGFYVLTRDRDATDAAPYAGVRVGAWNEVAGAQVFYAPPGGLSARAIRARVAEVAPDTIYLNSFFSPMTVRLLALRRLGLLPPAPVVIAPRGELSPGALSLKAPKKRAYLAAARAARLYGGLTWQASSDDEAAEIRRELGPAAVRVAPDIPAPLGGEPPAAPPKAPGRLRLVFLSRIAEKKNLHFLLELLPLLRAESVELDVYGPVREPAYWERCRGLMAGLPAQVVARHRGPVEHEAVGAALAGAHVFALPTLGENFGHAILEALAAGRPALVSDRTPWRGLAERGAGWDLPLEHGPWLAALQALVEMGQAEYEGWSRGARRHAAAFVAAPALVEANLALFLQPQRAYEAAPPVHP